MPGIDPRKAHCLTLTPPPPMLMAFPWCFPDAKVPNAKEGIYSRWGKGTTSQASGADCRVTSSPAPAYDTTECT